MADTKPEVLLVYPGKKSMGFTYPMGLLYVAQNLRKMGIEVTLHHMGIEPFSRIKKKDYLFVGLSLLTGEIITNGLKVARFIKSYNEDIPVVAGGVHVSLLPEESLGDELIDYLVVGEGDETIKEVAERLMEGRDLSGVAGVAYKDSKGRVVKNADRGFVDMDGLEFDVPYELLGEHFKSQNFMPVHTSRGCPYRCGFCYNPVVHKRRYRCKSAEKVVAEIEYLTEKYGVRGFGFDFEDEFFVNPARAYRIFQYVIDKDLNIRWTAFCRFDTFVKGYERFGRDFVEVLKKSGCHYISFGAESGSQRLLDEVIKKDIKVEHVYKTVEVLKEAGIPHRVSFICCFPSETEEDLGETFDVIERISTGNPYIVLGIFRLIPLPGTAIFDLLVKKYGFEHPSTLAEWGRYRMPDTSVRNVTWASKSYARRCEKIALLTNYPFFRDFGSYSEYREFVSRIDTTYGVGYIDYLLARIHRWRFKKRFFGFMVEAPLFNKVIDARMFFVRYVMKKYLPERYYSFLKKHFGKNLWKQTT